MGQPTADDERDRRSKVMGQFIRRRGFPPLIPCTGVEPSELIDQMDGLIPSSKITTDPGAQGYIQELKDTMEDGRPVTNAIDSL